MENIKNTDLESAMARLESVVEKISAEGVSLEEALTLYEEGIALVKQCNATLENAERKINALKLGKDGELLEVTFDTPNEVK